MSEVHIEQNLLRQYFCVNLRNLRQVSLNELPAYLKGKKVSRNGLPLSCAYNPLSTPHFRIFISSKIFQRQRFYPAFKSKLFYLVVYTDNIMSRDLSPQQNEIIFYTTPDGAVHIEVFFQQESFWLSQKKMAELFGVEVNTINYHLKEIFKSAELQEDATIRKIRIVQKEGNREVARDVDFYNLDAIIAVGYRVNSYQATRFRIWATQTLRDFPAVQ